jgi:PadR family transcriptional regulator, regulatory protein PadR
MSAEMLKGHLDVLLLSVIGDGALHGYAIIEALRTRSSGQFDLPEGTVYPALHRLELAELVTSDWHRPEGGRQRRVYRLTDKGRAALAGRRQLWNEFATGMERILGTPA